MSGRSIVRLAAALVVAAVVLAALPAAATGPPRPAAPRIEWSWLDAATHWLGALPARLAAISDGGHRAIRSQSEAESARCDQGAAIDPNGCPAKAQEDGAAIDPNG